VIDVGRFDVHEVELACVTRRGVLPHAALALAGIWSAQADPAHDPEIVARVR